MGNLRRIPDDGEEVIDEEGAESGECRRIETMGLLPLRTVFEKEKSVPAQRARWQSWTVCLRPPVRQMHIWLWRFIWGGRKLHVRRPAGTARLVPDRKEPEICRPMCYLFKGDTKQVQPDGLE